MNRYLGARSAELNRNKLIELKTLDELDQEAQKLRSQLTDINKSGADPAQLELGAPRIVVADAGIASSSLFDNQTRRSAGSKVAPAGVPPGKQLAPGPSIPSTQTRRQRPAGSDAVRVIASAGTRSRHAAPAAVKSGVIVTTGGGGLLPVSPPAPTAAKGQDLQGSGTRAQGQQQKSSDKILEMTPDMVFNGDVGKVGRTLRWAQRRHGPFAKHMGPSIPKPTLSRGSLHSSVHSNNSHTQ